MARYHALDRATDFPPPPSVQEWLCEQHLAHKVSGALNSPALSWIERACAGRAKQLTPPSETPLARNQINLAEDEARIMKQGR